MTTAAIFQFQKKREATFICSACGADRGCQCNAPAVEKLAELKERGRVAARESMRRKRKQNQHTVNVNTDEADETTLPEDPKNYRTSFLLRADLAKSAAIYSGPISSEIIRVAHSVAAAWSQLAQNLEANHEQESS